MSKKKNIWLDGNIFVKGIKAKYDKDNDCYLVNIDEIKKNRKHFSPKYTYIEIVGVKYQFNGIIIDNKLNWYCIYQKEENIHNTETNITDIINISPKYLSNINMCSLAIEWENIGIENIVNYIPMTDKTYTEIEKEGTKYYLAGLYIDFYKKPIMILSFSAD